MTVTGLLRDLPSLDQVTVAVASMTLPVLFGWASWSLPPTTLRYALLVSRSPCDTVTVMVSSAVMPLFSDSATSSPTCAVAGTASTSLYFRDSATSTSADSLPPV